MKQGIIFMPHGNLQYSQLPIQKRGWVAEKSYIKIFELVEKLGVKIAFEASGETLEIMAKDCPKSLQLLVSLIKRGLIEGVGSPNTHIMLANVDENVAYCSLVEGLDTWERLTGFRPTTGWNPECSFSSAIFDIYKKAGYKNIIADGDSYLLGAFEGVREKSGLQFDVRGHSNKNQLFKIENAIQNNLDAINSLTKPNKLPNGLNVILRSDMMCNLMLWYLMGATEGNREKPVDISEIKEVLLRWKNKIQGQGFIMPYAEDAEYCGTTAYFYVKQFGQARFFEEAPESVENFEEIFRLAMDMDFEFITPSDAVQKYGTIEGKNFEQIENGCAWHGGTAKAWANTAYSRILDPVCKSIYDGLMACCKKLEISNPLDVLDMRDVMTSIITSYVSDARWPPKPTSPGRFNVREALDALHLANKKMEIMMKNHKIDKILSLYSPRLMQSQIDAIDQELMSQEYFEEL